MQYYYPLMHSDSLNTSSVSTHQHQRHTIGGAGLMPEIPQPPQHHLSSNNPRSSPRLITPHGTPFRPTSGSLASPAGNNNNNNNNSNSLHTGGIPSAIPPAVVLNPSPSGIAAAGGGSAVGGSPSRAAAAIGGSPDSASAGINNESVSEAQVVAHVNALLNFCSIDKGVTSIRQCTSSLFVLLYQRLFDCTIQGIDRSPNTQEKKRLNMSLVLDELARRHYSLSGISADEAVALNKYHISRVVMVFVLIAQEQQEHQLQLLLQQQQQQQQQQQIYGMGMTAPPPGYTVAEVAPSSSQSPVDVGSIGGGGGAVDHPRAYPDGTQQQQQQQQEGPMYAMDSDPTGLSYYHHQQQQQLQHHHDMTTHLMQPGIIDESAGANNAHINGGEFAGPYEGYNDEEDEEYGEEGGYSQDGSFYVDKSVIPTEVLVQNWYKGIVSPELSGNSTPALAHTPPPVMHLSPAAGTKATPGRRSGGGGGGGGALDLSDIRQRHQQLSDTLDKRPSWHSQGGASHNRASGGLRIDEEEGATASENAARVHPTSQQQQQQRAGKRPPSAAQHDTSAFQRPSHTVVPLHPHQQPHQTRLKSSRPQGRSSQLGSSNHHQLHRGQQQPQRHRRMGSPVVIEEAPLSQEELRMFASHPGRLIDNHARDRKIECLRAARLLGDMQCSIRRRMRRQYDECVAQRREEMKESLQAARQEKIDRARRMKEENAKYRAAYITLMESATNDVRVPRYIMSRHTAQMAEYYAAALRESRNMCDYLETETERRNTVDLLNYAQSTTAWQQRLVA